MTFTLRGLGLEGDTLGSIYRRATLLAALGPIREEQAGFRHECLVSSCQSYNLQYIPVAHLCKVSAFGIVGTGYPCCLYCQELPRLWICRNIKALETLNSHVEVWKSKGNIY